jgi:predicted ArsR family transcriptional regulator
MPDLFDWKPALDPRARRHDPDTSHAAAASMATGAAAHREAILGVLNDHGDLTPEEIAARCGLSSVQVCRRMKELENAGRAVPTSEQRKTQSGRMARVWRVR